MNPVRATLSFALILSCAALFVLLSAAGLPEIVASHFDSAGLPNGFMPRHVYVRVMLAVLVVVPVLLIAPLYAATAGSGADLNLPNKAFWLQPQRLPLTVRYLRTQAMGFSVAVCLFVSFVHWLVVQANQRQPPRLSSPTILTGLIIFLAGVVVWVFSVYGHFKRGA